MKAVLAKALGGPETLVVENLPEPRPGPGEVLVQVRAAALNFFDTLIIQGRYQYKPDLPFSPGGECSGVAAWGAELGCGRPAGRLSGCCAAYAVVECAGLSSCGGAGATVVGGAADWGAGGGAAV